MMIKINKKLILIFTILAFVFGLFWVTPVEAYNDGVIPFPYYNYNSGSRGNDYYYNRNPVYQQPIYYSNPIPVYVPVAYNPQIVIDGCEGRNTGFSTINGQSCVGSYVAPTRNNTSSTRTTNTTTVKNNTTNTTTDNTVVKTTDESKTTTPTNDVNEDYGSLTANALAGSNSFLPTGLLQWIFLALIIVAIIFLWRYVHAEDKYLAEPMKHA